MIAAISLAPSLLVLAMFALIRSGRLTPVEWLQPVVGVLSGLCVLLPIGAGIAIPFATRSERKVWCSFILSVLLFVASLGLIALAMWPEVRKIRGG